METERVTQEEFEALGGGGGGRALRPETILALALNPNEGIRLKNHDHKVSPSNPAGCRLGRTIKMTTQNHGLKVTYLHDGPDLVVFRLA